MSNYELFFDEQRGRLELKNVSNSKRLLGSYKNYPNELTRFNDCYYVSSNRDVLRQKALELKQQWIVKAQNRVDELTAIKI